MRIILGCFLLLELLISPLVAQQQEKANYFTAGNGITESSDPKWRRRQMTLLVEPEDFTDEKLIQLAEDLYKKYPDPDSLKISLLSHIDQLPVFIGQRHDEAMSKYPDGIIHRFNGNEFIRYKIPPNREWRTIVLKGKA